MLNLTSLVLLFAVLHMLNGTAAARETWVQSSVLSAGTWYKMSVVEEGIYRIDYSVLKQLGMANISNPRIYGNNFGQLSYYNDDNKPDDLEEIPVFMYKGSDNVFNEGDYLLFYAKGTHRWKYNYLTGSYVFSRHNYSDTAFYFLTSSTSGGRLMSTAPEITQSPDYSTSSYDALFIHENETENLIKSGREWFQPVSSVSGLTVNPGFTDLITSEPVTYTVKVLGRSSVPTMFRLYEGDSMLEGILVPEVSILSTTGTYARDVTAEGSAQPLTATPSYSVRFYNNGEQAAKGWLDYLMLQGRSMIHYTGKFLTFSDSRTVSPGRITEYNVGSSVSAISIWDITDPHNPEIIQYNRSGENNTFRAITDSLRIYAAFSAGDVLTPRISQTPLNNQDLHGSFPADMVIVTHPLFLEYAHKLADFHAGNSGLITLVVTPREIYNEFSGGIPDIAAIRNFLRMKFIKQKESAHPLKYLLLFGDGSVENKTLPPSNPNFVPTYQSQNSTVVVSSFTSDDFYGLLEEGEGEAEGTEDIGIGRFPVSDTSQASIMVSKVIRYMSPESKGSWKNVVAVVADDEDANTHMIDAEGLYTLLNTKYPSFNVDKIYLDAFKQVTSVNGQSYPEATKKIDDRINAGCLIFDYLGHGNEIGLAHERVVKTENINSWRNGARMPLFITATCEFSRFDDIEIDPISKQMTGKTSAGEMVLLNQDGGGIALMTTTRVVYSAPNYTLNRNILDYAFRPDSTGKAYCLGDIIRIAKNNSGSGLNKRNFSLLGDPAVQLAYPWHGRVVTDSVNNVPVTQPTDSIKALSLITIAGHIADNYGTLINDFDGIVYPLVYDKTSRISTLANDGGQVMEFDLRNNVIFSGKTIAENGRFRFTFVVPKDIDYSYGSGKISYYATEGTLDMGGSYGEIIVGGFSNVPVTDTSGPSIKLFLNDTLFRNGGICDDNPLLLAIIEDSGGINTTGSGIGHDLIAFIDDNRGNPYILNNYYESDLNNYRKGRVYYPLGDIDAGQHTLTLKAWDNLNNSSSETLKFIVRGEEGFIVTNLVNYPNPVTNDTRITAEHNRPDDELEIRIDIFSMNGRIIKTIDLNMPSTGYRLQPILWDGNDDGGNRVARGVYPYRVTIRTSRGEISRATGRMIIL